jgi:sugar lactone lactonase YvrE
MRMRDLAAMMTLVMLAGSGWAEESGLNPFAGRQEAEKVFEFAAKPVVKKQGDPSAGSGQGKYVISFAAKAACDATVAIVAPSTNPAQEKIVRHLASGVLGKNAPWPFKQGSLEQTIEWDGKDDFGKPAPAGCRAKVGLGLQARYDRSLGWAPGKAAARVGIAVDRDGRLFVLDGSTGEGGGVSYSIKVYDREGRYLRQIAPPMAHVAGKAATMAWNKTAWGTLAPSTTGGYHGTTITKNYNIGTLAVRQVPVVTRDGRFVFVTPSNRTQSFRQLIMVSGADGAVPADGIVTIDKGFKIFGKGSPHNNGPLYMALSPDEKWLYLGSPEEVGNVHGVFRMDMANPGMPTLFAGEAGKAGADEAHFNGPRGVACDKDGNVYVADSGNNRIQVFKPDGGYLGTIPVQGPKMIAVHRKTGEVYVLQLLAPRQMKLVKLGGLKDPAVKIQGPVLGTYYEESRLPLAPLLALDDTGETTQVWLKGHGNGVSRLRDAGASFEKLSAGDINRVEKGWERWDPCAHQCQIAADPVREELYIREEGMCFAGSMIRVDGRTGRVLDRFGQAAVGGSTPFGVEQARVSADGRVYFRAGHAGTMLIEYDPATKMLKDLLGAKPADKRWMWKGKPFNAIHIPADGRCRTFQDVMGIAPNGDLYIPCGIRDDDVHLLKEAGLEPLPRKEIFGPFNGSLLKVYSADGKLKCLSVLPGLGPSQGVSVGRNGEVYVALECQPIGAKQPDGLAPGASFSGNLWGTVVKFDSRFDKYPIGRINGRWTADLGGAPTHRWLSGGFKNEKRGAGPVRIENVMWEYPGFGLFKGSSCNCPKSNISMDGFERLFVPALHTSTVNVLDANGNIVVRIGGYGNADSRGADSPVPDPKTGELRPRRRDDPAGLKSPLAEPDIGLSHPNFTAVTDEALYVNDKGNYRIVRAKLGYVAEEVVALP